MKHFLTIEHPSPPSWGWAKSIILGHLVLLMSGLPLAGCGKEPAVGASGSVTQLTEPEDALSEALMLSLGQARNFHHKADLLLAQGKIDPAAQAVAEVLTIPFPADAAESEDVILDTHARLAKLRILQARLDDAMSLVDEGIATATRDSFFVANLHSVRGEVFEARAKRAEPNSEAATQATIDAISAFDASIRINKDLLKRIEAGK